MTEMHEVLKNFFPPLYERGGCSDSASWHSAGAVDLNFADNKEIYKKIGCCGRVQPGRQDGQEFP